MVKSINYVIQFFPQAFYNSGKLTEMIEQGRTYCFISNIDNMGATVDFGILKVKSLWTTL